MNPINHYDKVIELLTVMVNHPALYFGSDDNVQSAENFINGFNIALLSIYDSESMNLPALLEPGHVSRGWEFRAFSVSKTLRERGFTEKEIVVELIQITISCWETFFKKQQF